MTEEERAAHKTQVLRDRKNRARARRTADLAIEEQMGKPVPLPPAAGGESELFWELRGTAEQE